MKTIIAGSRNIADYRIVERTVKESGFTITEVVSGCSRGVDRLGEEWAGRHSIPVKKFPAEWDRYGKSAGPRRNEQMVAYAEALITIWDGQSRGTGHVIGCATQHGLKVYVLRTDQVNPDKSAKLTPHQSVCRRSQPAAYYYGEWYVERLKFSAVFAAGIIVIYGLYRVGEVAWAWIVNLWH